MALPTAAPERVLQHRRSTDVQIYSRGNGLWEVDAEVKDTKTRDAALANGVRPAGEVQGTREDSASGQRPFQIDRCHALRAGGPVVQTFYPRWYRATPV